MFPESNSDAPEFVAAFIIEQTRAQKGTRWDQGPRRDRVERPNLPPQTEALAVLSKRRMCEVPEPAVRALLGWATGTHPAVFSRVIPRAEQVLSMQAQGLRYVSVVPDAVALAHGDPRHPDGLSFVLHDLCHLEKFADPAHHVGQRGFFRRFLSGMGHPVLAGAAFDADWVTGRDYVMADMNGSAIFLFAALKMKLKMAVRRALARRRGSEGGPTATAGALNEAEAAAFEPVLEGLLDALGLCGDPRRAASQVSARRDDPSAALCLLEEFESAGRTPWPAVNPSDDQFESH